MTVHELNAALAALTPPADLRDRIAALQAIPAQEKRPAKPWRLFSRPKKQRHAALPVRAKANRRWIALPALVALALLLTLPYVFRDAAPAGQTPGPASASTYPQTGIESAAPTFVFADVAGLAEHLLKETNWAELYVPRGPFASIEFVPDRNEVVFRSEKFSVSVLVFPTEEAANEFAAQTPGYAAVSRFAHNDIRPETQGQSTFSGIKSLRELASTGK